MKLNKVNDNILYIGIDPGIHGAVAVMYNGSLLAAFDSPIHRHVGKQERIDGNKLTEILINQKVLTGADSVVVWIERVHSMPKQGVASSFNFGLVFGQVIGVCEALGWTVNLVEPQAWKKKFGLIGTPKDTCRQLVKRMVADGQQEWFKFKKNVDRADAVLIAYYGAVK